MYKLAQQKQQREAKSPVRSGYSVAHASASVQIHAANISSQSQNNLEVSTRYEPVQPEPKKDEELARDPSIADDQPNMADKVTDKAPSPELVIPATAAPEEKMESKAASPVKAPVKQEEDRAGSQLTASKKSLE